MIELQSSDGQIVKVEVKVAQCSRMLKDMIEALGATDNEVIPIPPNAPNITGDILRKIMQWADQHKVIFVSLLLLCMQLEMSISTSFKDDPAPAEDDGKKVKPRDDISSWDAEFLQVDLSTLFKLIRVRELNIERIFHKDKIKNLNEFPP